LGGNRSMVGRFVGRRVKVDTEIERGTLGERAGTVVDSMVAL
jgi:hypothetical protein